MILFLIFGWMKLTNFGATVTAMEGYGTPMPYLAAVVAVVVEFIFGIFIVLGAFTRPIAIIYALYVLGTAFIGHPFWRFSGAEMIGNEINFFKNISIIAGLLLLASQVLAVTLWIISGLTANAPSMAALPCAAILTP
ncbi:Inner membrane protein yphA [Serratia fonticola]|uniref:Inner membrane protein yphA n=1 Tax=Serratia fonticola TaxID=47917 RepID=A0A4U9WMU2_SERFO|nr:Inner membrane protein yphA [Serratia fonticola]